MVEENKEVKNDKPEVDDMIPAGMLWAGLQNEFKKRENLVHEQTSLLNLVGQEIYLTACAQAYSDCFRLIQVLVNEKKTNKKE